MTEVRNITTPYGKIYAGTYITRRQAKALRTLLEAADDRAFSDARMVPKDQPEIDRAYKDAIQYVARLSAMGGQNA